MYAGVPFFFPILFHPLRFTLKVRQDLIGRNAMDTHAKPLEKARLVEDNDSMQKIHSLYLKELGLEVDRADTGYKALELAAQQDYPCILLHIGLPDITGESVLAAIRYRERATGQHVSIIVNSAHASPSLLKRCRESGAEAVFEKPLTIEQVREALAPTRQSEKGNGSEVDGQ